MQECIGGNPIWEIPCLGWECIQYTWGGGETDSNESQG